MEISPLHKRMTFTQLAKRVNAFKNRTAIEVQQIARWSQWLKDVEVYYYDDIDCPDIVICYRNLIKGSGNNCELLYRPDIGEALEAKAKAISADSSHSAMVQNVINAQSMLNQYRQSVGMVEDDNIHLIPNDLDVQLAFTLRQLNKNIKSVEQLMRRKTYAMDKLTDDGLTVYKSEYVFSGAMKLESLSVIYTEAANGQVVNCYLIPKVKSDGEEFVFNDFIKQKDIYHHIFDSKQLAMIQRVETLLAQKQLLAMKFQVHK